MPDAGVEAEEDEPPAAAAAAAAVLAADSAKVGMAEGLGGSSGGGAGFAMATFTASCIVTI